MSLWKVKYPLSLYNYIELGIFMASGDGTELGVKNELWIGLRNCQRQIVERALKYTRVPLSTNSNKACLIKAYIRSHYHRRRTFRAFARMADAGSRK